MESLKKTSKDNDCKICKGKGSVRIYPRLNLGLCSICGLIHQINTNMNKSKAIYTDGYMLDYTVSPTYYPMLLGRAFFIDGLKGVVNKEIYTDNKKDTLLDVGCNDGGLLRLLQLSGEYSRVAGVEINKDAIKRIGNEFLIYDDLFKVDQEYSVVTFFDSLEHFPNPYRAIHHTSNVIQPDLIIVATPNADNFTKDNLNLIEQWHHYKPDEHLFYFSKKNLEILFSRYGYRVFYAGFSETMVRNNKIKHRNILTMAFVKSKIEV